MSLDILNDTTGALSVFISITRQPLASVLALKLHDTHSSPVLLSTVYWIFVTSNVPASEKNHWLLILVKDLGCSLIVTGSE